MNSDTNDHLMVQLENLEKSATTSDERDLPTRASHVIYESMIKHMNINDSTATYLRWFSAILGWIYYKFPNIDAENDLSIKRNDQLTNIACRAAFQSFQLVIDQVGMFNAKHCFSGTNTITLLCERVLSSFDLFCKDMSVENSWDAIHLKDNIIKSSNLAKEYIRFQTCQLRLPEDTRIYDYHILMSLQSNLVSNTAPEATTSYIHGNTNKALDDELVGLDDDLRKIKARLIGTSVKLEVIPIVGMGGIGKTTLTRRVYEDPQIKMHFHVRAWLLVSQRYHERDVLLGLLQSIAPLSQEVYKEDREELEERLYKRLKGWRYFLVIDDIWAKEAWDNMKLIFPDDRNGSRIILTSRLAEVASHVHPENPPHFMNFLGLEHSCDLLNKLVFRKESCPLDLVNVGKRIAEKCQGLPLAVKVVAGHLSKMSMNKECWENVAENVGLSEVSQMESLLNILSISYNNLPQHLKACFLTLVTFPKNCDVPVRKLTRYWTAMGFLCSNTIDSNLEEVAMKCLEDLISRSLIMVKKRKVDGKVKSCGIHDLLWDLSLREARKEGEYIFANTCLNHSYSDTSKYVMDLCHTLVYFDHSFEADFPFNSQELKLLTILDIVNQSFDHFPDEVTDLVNLRYLALATAGNVPSSIFKIFNLETLINNHDFASKDLPKEIWLLSRLRHLHVRTRTYWPNPISVLENLSELSTICSACCTMEVFSNVPNLSELRIDHYVMKGKTIRDELLLNCLRNLVCLQKLEKLTLYCTGQLVMPSLIPQWDSFIPKIKNLALSGTCLPWCEMNALARLPNLEILKVKKYSFIGNEWNTDEAFPILKCLVLESLEFAFWNADKDHFPNLHSLVIRNCRGLSRIPINFGEISTLHLIDMEYCGYIACQSAREIQMEQLNMGNEELIVRIGRMSAKVKVLSLCFLEFLLLLYYFEKIMIYASYKF